MESVLEEIERDQQWAQRITHWRHLPAQPCRYGEWPAGIDRRLIEALGRQGIEAPYRHQTLAVEAVLRGEHVVVVTPTASGKTLCYNLPVLNRQLAEREERSRRRWRAFFAAVGILALWGAVMLAAGLIR